MHLEKNFLITTAVLAACITLPIFASPEGPFRGPDSPEDRARLIAQAGNLRRFEPGGFTPCVDGNHINAHGPGIIYRNGTYFMVGERRAAWAAEGVNLYSSTDLYNWRLLGNILPTVEEEGHPLEVGCIIERPKLLFNEKTGKYVLWFHHELRGQGYAPALVGVAKSDTVTGPYKFLHSFRPNGHDSRDMTVFMDYDGSAYLIYASEVNFMLRVAQLTDDFLAVTPRDKPLFRHHREAPAIFRHRGTLFLFTSAATGWNPNPSRLHVADSIWGPWEHLQNPARGDGANTTFFSQPAFILRVQGRENAFIYIGNRWRPGNLINSPRVWLPIEFDENGLPFFRWHDHWDLSFFDKTGAATK